jgi:hypothetical protein
LKQQDVLNYVCNSIILYNYVCNSICITLIYSFVSIVPTIYQQASTYFWNDWKTIRGHPQQAPQENHHTNWAFYGEIFKFRCPCTS